MAHTEHLPIYKAAYDLCLYLEQVVRHFSRYHKYTLGTDLRDTARRALKLVVREAGTQCLVFCPVGQFIEFYGPQRLLATTALELQPARLPRAGYALTVGFPAHLFGIYRTRALRQGLAVLEVRQGPEMLTARCRERRPARLFLPRLET